MRWYRHRRAMLLAVLTVGTAMQAATCAQEAQLFGIRTVFSAFTLPINTLIVLFFNAIGQALPFPSVI